MTGQPMKMKRIRSVLTCAMMLCVALVVAVACASIDRSKMRDFTSDGPLSYKFDYISYPKHMVVQVDISFCKGDWVPIDPGGNGFVSCPQSASVRIHSEDINGASPDEDIKLTLDCVTAGRLLEIIGTSEVFSLPEYEKGPEPCSLYEEDRAILERTYKGKRTRIVRNALASIPTRECLSELQLILDENIHKDPNMPNEIIILPNENETKKRPDGQP